MQDELAGLKPKFPLGQTVMTRGAEVEIPMAEMFVALRRHHGGDWGDLGAEDKAANEEALVTEGRLFSKYFSAAGVSFYIITEWDRSVTTVLLPQEY